MSQEPKLIAAIDIGTNKIVVMVARKSPNHSIEILGAKSVCSTGVKRGLILNIELTANSIKQAVLALEQELDLHLTEVYVGMASQGIRSLTNKCYRFINPSDEISNFDLEQLLLDSHRISIEPGDKVLHVIPQDYSVDNEVGEKNPVGMCGHRLEGNFHVVVGREGSINSIERSIQRAGLSLSGVIFNPLAASHAVLSEEEMEAGVVVLDMGGGTTDMALYYDGVIRYSAVIPMGGNLITSDVKEGFSILTKQAEALKVKFGSAMPLAEADDMLISIPGVSGWEPKEVSPSMLANVIQARVEEIVEYIVCNIEQSGYYDRLGAGIVLTGGGSQLKNIASLVKLKTGLDVRIGFPRNEMLEHLVPEQDLISYVSALGIVKGSSIYLKERAQEQKLFDVPQERETEADRVVTSRVNRKGKTKNQTGESAKAGNFLGNFRQKVAYLFDDGDVEM